NNAELGGMLRLLTRGKPVVASAIVVKLAARKRDDRKLLQAFVDELGNNPGLIEAEFDRAAGGILNTNKKIEALRARSHTELDMIALSSLLIRFQSYEALLGEIMRRWKPNGASHDSGHSPSPILDVLAGMHEESRQINHLDRATFDEYAEQAQKQTFNNFV